MAQETGTAYVVVYTNQYPEDGFELGGVYDNYDDAQEAANNREHCDMGREYADVVECPFHVDKDRIQNLVQQSMQEAAQFHRRRGNRHSY